MEPTWWRGEWY